MNVNEIKDELNNIRQVLTSLLSDAHHMLILEDTEEEICDTCIDHSGHHVAWAETWHEKQLKFAQHTSINRGAELRKYRKEIYVLRSVLLDLFPDEMLGDEEIIESAIRIITKLRNQLATPDICGATFAVFPIEERWADTEVRAVAALYVCDLAPGHADGPIALHMDQGAKKAWL